MDPNTTKNAGQREEGSDTGCCSQLNRRQFVGASGATLAALGTGGAIDAIAGPFDKKDVIDHFVPADKKLKPQWLKQLFEKGDRTWYSGDDLKTIGMPVGGICAGQVYLTGDGRLVYWDIFNQNINSGYGAANYKVGREPTEMVVRHSDFESAPAVDQGVAVQVQTQGKSLVRSLDREGFPGCAFLWGVSDRLC